MNMKFLSVVTSPPDIYHGWCTGKKFREDNFTPFKITSCARRNVRKHREINNGKKYIILEISSNIDCLDKREMVSLELRDYMVRTGKGMTTYMYLSTKTPNNKKKERFAITDITKQYLRNLFNKFRN